MDADEYTEVMCEQMHNGGNPNSSTKKLTGWQSRKNDSIDEKQTRQAWAIKASWSHFFGILYLIRYSPRDQQSFFLKKDLRIKKLTQKERSSSIPHSVKFTERYSTKRNCRVRGRCEMFWLKKHNYMVLQVLWIWVPFIFVVRSGNPSCRSEK